MSAVFDSADRLLTFELGGMLYALPISGVLEVAEALELACVPTLPPSLGGVVNHHGDALPVVHGAALLGDGHGETPGEERVADGRPRQLLVVTDRRSGNAQLGLPVDRVLGLADGRGEKSRDGDPVADRRPLAGRVACVLDPERLVSKAREVIEALAGPGGNA